MGEHTPGPWEVRELLEDGVIVQQSHTYELHTPGYDVATLIPHGGPFRKLADAQIAAAAPDLLMACEMAHQFVAYYANIEANEDTLATRLESRLAAAIAKAKGETL